MAVRTQKTKKGLNIFLKAFSHDPFSRAPLPLVPKNGSCEHIKNDLPSNGSLILKKRMEIEHALFSSDTLLEDERHRQILHDRLGAKSKILLSVLKNGSCEHTTNDLPTFSPQKQNLQIGPSKRLLPVFGTKNQILKNGSCGLALNEAFGESKSDKIDKRGSYSEYSCRLLVGFCNIKLD